MVFSLPVDQTTGGSGESEIILGVGILVSYEACTKGEFHD
jgi:hypothetical protein